MDRTSWKPKIFKATETVDYKAEEGSHSHYTDYFDQAYYDRNDEKPITGYKQCDYCDSQFRQYDDKGMIDHANSTHNADLDSNTGEKPNRTFPSWDLSRESKTSEARRWNDDLDGFFYNYDYDRKPTVDDWLEFVFQINNYDKKIYYKLVPEAKKAWKKYTGRESKASEGKVKSYCNICGYDTWRNEGEDCPYHQRVLSDGTFLWDEFNQDGEAYDKYGNRNNETCPNCGNTEAPFLIDDEFCNNCYVKPPESKWEKYDRYTSYGISDEEARGDIWNESKASEHDVDKGWSYDILEGNFTDRTICTHCGIDTTDLSEDMMVQHLIDEHGLDKKDRWSTESKANEDDHKKSWDKLDSIAKQGFSDIGYDQKSWDSEPEEIREEMETVVKDNLGENWKEVANKFYKEELNKGKKSGGESKANEDSESQQRGLSDSEEEELIEQTLEEWKIRHLPYMSVGQDVSYNAFKIFAQSKNLTQSEIDYLWTNGANPELTSESKASEARKLNTRQKKLIEEWVGSMSSPPMVITSDDLPYSLLSELRGINDFDGFESAIMRYASDIGNKQAMQGSNPYMHSSNYGSFESKASEHGRYYTELDAEAEDIIDQWVSQYLKLNLYGDPDAEDIPNDVWDRLEKTDGGERMNTDDVQRYMDENIDFSSYESMTQMDDSSDSPSTVASGRKIMKGQLKAYNDNPTPEGDQYGQPLGFPWQYGGENNFVYDYEASWKNATLKKERLHLLLEADKAIDNNLIAELIEKNWEDLPSELQQKIKSAGVIPMYESKASEGVRESNDWECKDCGVKTSDPTQHQKDTGHNNIEQTPRFGGCINCGSPVEAPYYIEDYVDCKNCGTHFKFYDAKSLESKASEFVDADGDYIDYTDSLSKNIFGKKFNELTDSEREQIRDNLDWSKFNSISYNESKANESTIEEEFYNWDLENTGNPYTLSNWVDYALKDNFTEDEVREFWKKKLDDGWSTESKTSETMSTIPHTDDKNCQHPDCLGARAEDILFNNFVSPRGGGMKCNHCDKYFEKEPEPTFNSAQVLNQPIIHDLLYHAKTHGIESEAMTQMDDSSDSPSTINTARKMMKGQLDSYNDNPTPEERYEDPLITMGYPWQRGGENDFSKKYSYLDKPQVKDEIMPMVDLYHGGQRIGHIRDYNPMGHLGLVTMDAIGIEEYGALPSDYEAYINGKRIPNKWDNQVDHNASLFGENDMKDYEKYDDWDDESEVRNTESWGHWSDNDPPMIAHDQIKLMRDLGIADKTLKDMGYNLHKDGGEGLIERIEKELNKFGINLDKDKDQVEESKASEGLFYEISKHYKEVVEDGRIINYQCNSCGEKINVDDEFGDEKDDDILIQELRDHQEFHGEVFESKASEGILVQVVNQRGNATWSNQSGYNEVIDEKKAHDMEEAEQIKRDFFQQYKEAHDMEEINGRPVNLVIHMTSDGDDGSYGRFQYSGVNYFPSAWNNYKGESKASENKDVTDYFYIEDDDFRWTQNDDYVETAICDICGNSWEQDEFLLKNLTNHLSNVHNIHVGESKTSEGFDQGLYGDVDAKCKTCGVEFDSIPDMNDHYAMHSDHISNLDDLDSNIPNSD